MAFCIKHEGELQLDCTYETRYGAALHYLAFCTGEYDESEFHIGPDSLDVYVEFDKYTDAELVEVTVSEND